MVKRSETRLEGHDDRKNGCFLIRPEINQRMSRLNTKYTEISLKNAADAIPANEQSVHKGTTNSFIFYLNAPESIIIQTHLLDIMFICYVWKSTSKSEVMVLDQKKGQGLDSCLKWRSLSIWFTSEGRMEREVDRRIDVSVCRGEERLCSYPHPWSRPKE